MNPEESQLLVVDDNEVNRDMLSRRLKRRGFAVETAPNGHEALKMIDGGGFDLILLDIMMPGLNGLEVLKILRQKYSTAELPVIMATAKDRSEDVVEALELGANDYVTKPIDFPIVLARVISHLKQKVAKAPAKHEAGPSASEIQPGVVLAEKYQLDEVLGTGSFGAVYRGTHLSLQQSVAVKVLQTNMAPASEALARFQREGISACRVRHPNAVSVLDFGITPTGVAYLVMELLEGRSLADELKESGMLSPIRCLEILRPVCDVLSEAHGAGLVHRDIKPANIFLHQGHSGEIVKVLDFGIAKIVGDATGEAHLTVEGSILGTPTYMAPERFSNEPYDGRADVYSLGVLLYRMLGGKTPFHSKDLMSVAMQHLREKPRPLRELNPVVTPEIEAVVERALAKHMNERPSAAELPKLFGRAVGQRRSDRESQSRPSPSPSPPVASSASTLEPPAVPERSDGKGEAASSLRPPAATPASEDADAIHQETHLIDSQEVQPVEPDSVPVPPSAPAPADSAVPGPANPPQGSGSGPQTQPQPQPESQSESQSLRREPPRPASHSPKPVPTGDRSSVRKLLDKLFEGDS